MAEPLSHRSTAGGWTSTAAFDEGLRQHMLQVYNYMGLGLAMTGVVAFLVAATPPSTGRSSARRSNGW